MRGEIENRERRQQIIDYSGLTYKNITPTDIDGTGEFLQVPGFFEIRKKIFIFIEIKLIGAPFADGQRWAYENLVNSINKPAVCFYAEHNIDKTDEDIPAHLCIVKQYYCQGRWKTPEEKSTLKTMIDKFLEYHGFSEYLKEK